MIVNRFIIKLFKTEPNITKSIIYKSYRSTLGFLDKELLNLFSPNINIMNVYLLLSKFHTLFIKESSLVETI